MNPYDPFLKLHLIAFPKTYNRYHPLSRENDTLDDYKSQEYNDDNRSDMRKNFAYSENPDHADISRYQNTENEVNLSSKGMQIGCLMKNEPSEPSEFERGIAGWSICSKIKILRPPLLTHMNHGTLEKNNAYKNLSSIRFLQRCSRGTDIADESHSIKQILNSTSSEGFHDNDGNERLALPGKHSRYARKKGKKSNKNYRREYRSGRMIQRGIKGRKRRGQILFSTGTSQSTRFESAIKPKLNFIKHQCTQSYRRIQQKSIKKDFHNTHEDFPQLSNSNGDRNMSKYFRSNKNFENIVPYERHDRETENCWNQNRTARMIKNLHSSSLWTMNRSCDDGILIDVDNIERRNERGRRKRSQSCCDLEVPMQQRFKEELDTSVYPVSKDKTISYGASRMTILGYLHPNKQQKFQSFDIAKTMSESMLKPSLDHSMKFQNNAVGFNSRGRKEMRKLWKYKIFSNNVTEKCSTSNEKESEKKKLHELDRMNELIKEDTDQDETETASDLASTLGFPIEEIWENVI